MAENYIILFYYFKKTL